MLKQTALTRPVSSAFATSREVSFESSPSGFSQTTCFPASSAAIAWSKWTWLGLATWTTSTRSSESKASRSWYTSGRLAARAFSLARSGLDPITPTTLTPSRRSASTWATPMKPVPTTAALMSVNAIHTLLSLAGRRNDATPPPPAAGPSHISCCPQPGGVAAGVLGVRRFEQSRRPRLSDDGRRRDHGRHRPALHQQFYHLDLDLVDHRDRKSTRLNSSHVRISYAVFCLKKK